MLKNEILKIIDNNPLRLRESYFMNNYPELHSKINGYTKELNFLTFKQKIWHFINDKPDMAICIKCKKPVSFHKNWLNGYKLYCSSKCTQSDELTKKKRKETTIQKYGVDNIAKLEETKNKQAATNIKKYGTKSSFQNEDVKQKWRHTIKAKYDVDHVFQIEDIKNKSKSTNLLKWGVEHFTKSDAFKKLLNEIGFSDIIKRNNYLKQIEKYLQHNIEFLNLEGRVLSLISKNCGHQFYIHYDSVMRRLDNGYEVCTICNPVNTGQSQEEKILISWLRELDVDIIEKDRRFGIELDIFIPSKNIAIEFNGLYWHSEIYKDKLYHISKTNICKENSIRLIHIWEDDWKYKRDIVKSIILNSLGLIENKIWTRKCKIGIVNNRDKNIFLEENHIQGTCSSSINLALKFNDEIISIMTFGYRNINGKREFELLRFCNKKGCLVTGAASKLFNYFIKNNDFDIIYSYADISQFSGELYNILNFQYSHRSRPNYWWVVDGIRKHRFNYNKKTLIKNGSDPLKTEVEIMYSLGYYRIFGCGQDKYIFNN